ncbi:MAG TPA: hypothetical protein VHZ30_06305, partial [Verrucomicrobiae bacterium]|nr:hypothetical protein [Verrucomicrobiae bacterium]
KRQIRLLRDRAKVLRRSQAAIVRELIDEHLGTAKKQSLHELAGDFRWSISGPRDLSTRKSRSVIPLLAPF